ncbi:TPA: hypothetical protein ACW7QV_003348 [Citrobacter braakii]
MKSFAKIDRKYPMSGGAVASKKQPSAAKQSDGFRPTYVNAIGQTILGDAVDPAELNFIFNDLYAQADHIDQLLAAKGK